jgi:aryl-alcohol dehydrogenase-like predicted oxidoreductase
MEKRQFGATDLRVSALGFGCAALGSRTERGAAMNAVRKAADCGINFFDTAPFYGQGESERIIGAAFGKARDRVIIATKVGLYPSLTLRVAARLKPMVRSVLKALPGAGQKSFQKSVQGFMRSNKQVKFDRKSLVDSVDASLKRLRTDYIDLLLLHVTPEPHEIAEAVDQLSQLKQQGKIRHFGSSAQDTPDLMRWLERRGSGIDAVQIMLNLCEIDAMDACLPAAAAERVAVIAREPFARGRLIPPREPKSNGLGFIGDNYDDRFQDYARQLGRTVPQIAIQFLAQTPGIAVVLAGMSTIDHLLQNVAALDLPKLTEQQNSAIRSIGLELEIDEIGRTRRPHQQNAAEQPSRSQGTDG